MSRKLDYGALNQRMIAGSRSTLSILPNGGLQTYRQGSTIQFQVVSGGGYMDTQSCYVKCRFTIENPATTGAGIPLYSPNGINSVIESMRCVSANGDLLFYSDEISILQSLLQYQTVSSDYASHSGEMQGFYNGDPRTQADADGKAGVLKCDASSTNSKDFVFYLDVCPLFQMQSFLPLKHMAGPYAFLVELKLVSNPARVLRTSVYDGNAGTAGGNPSGNLTGIAYSLSKVEMVYDVLQLERDVDEAIQKGLQEGGVLTLGMKTIQHQAQQLPTGLTSHNTLWNVPDRSVNWLMYAFTDQALLNDVRFAATDALCRPKATNNFGYTITYGSKQWPSNGIYDTRDMLQQCMKVFGRMKLSAVNPNQISREEYFGTRGDLANVVERPASGAFTFAANEGADLAESQKAHKFALGQSLEVFADGEAGYDGVNTLTQNSGPIVLKLVGIDTSNSNVKNIDLFWESDRTMLISAQRTTVAI